MVRHPPAHQRHCFLGLRVTDYRYENEKGCNRAQLIFVHSWWYEGKLLHNISCARANRENSVILSRQRITTGRYVGIFITNLYRTYGTFFIQDILMLTVIEHVKGSDLIKTMRKNLPALPDRYYTISLEEEDHEPCSDDETHRDCLERIQQAKQSLAEGKGIPHEQVMKELRTHLKRKMPSKT